MSQGYRVLSRDPFGRRDYVRKIAEVHLRNCAFCGAVRKGSLKRETAGLLAVAQVQLYQYGEAHDDKAAPYWSKQAFCSVSCARSYQS